MEGTERVGLQLFNVVFADLKLITLGQTVKAGFPSPATDYREEDINLAKLLSLDSPSVFLAKVEGDSMEDAHCPNGTILIIDRSIKPESNQIVVAVLNGGFVVKRIVKSKSGWMLYSANTNYPPYVIKEGDDFEVWGVVTKFIVSPM